MLECDGCPLSETDLAVLELTSLSGLGGDLLSFYHLSTFRSGFVECLTVKVILALEEPSRSCPHGNKLAGPRLSSP